MGVAITTINPATGKVIQQYAQHTPEETNARLDALHQGWQQWKVLSFEERGQHFLAISKKILENKDAYARLMTQEMGKPIRLARAEIEKCAWVCEYFAQQAAQFLQDEIVSTSLKKSIIQYQPMGVLLAIMPWNYPFWQVFRAAATSMMAGNVFLLKHAEISTGTALVIEALFQAVVPMPVFSSVVLDNAATSALIAHEKIAAVTLTGSVRAGRAVAQSAGQALKKCVLELGGSDPYIILADADITLAAKLCVQGRLANSGQVCIAPKRLIVVDAIYDDFRAAVLSQVSAYVCGDPLNEDTLLGPMAREDLRDLLIQQVQESIDKGAILLIGGHVSLEDDGFYYPATVLDNVTPGMPAFDDELFGPVIALVRAQDEADAIRLANQSVYGLGAGVFTQNTEHGEYIASHCLDAGACHVNSLVSSDPRMPFGGVKTSGLGYELGAAGIREFVHIKTVGIA